MDHRTFLHYMLDHNDQPSCKDPLRDRDSTFLKRLPKKVGCSIFSEPPKDLPFGWGVHILEGPNKAVIAWIVFTGLLLSFVVSLIYAIVARTQEQGFGIGQWMVAVYTIGLTAVFFQFSEM